MKKILMLAVLALPLAGCYSPQDRALGGAALGGTAGAVIGGLATGKAGGALAGGAIGAVGGAMIGAATAPRDYAPPPPPASRYRDCWEDYYGRTTCRETTYRRY